MIDRLNAALEGRYVIERELGEGGMATVYLARDEKHNRGVALKVLKPELAAVVGADRFLAEIETTAQLQHPHILPLFDSGQADGFLFYVMPYVEGETLRERIDRDKQLPVDEAVGIAVAVANALQTAHEAGVVHRDIKPGNILLSRGEPLVADFGIALAVGTASGTRLTETGLSVGTPYYMSPEQATGDQAIGAASDIYALGAVLYEMLVGEPPYVGNTAQAVLGKILQGAPVSATSIRKSIPLNVDAALDKALEKLPADRFTSAHDFARALGDPAFRHGMGPGSATAAPGSSRWKAIALGSAAVAVLALGGLVTVASRPASAPISGGGIARFETPFRPGQEPAFFSTTAYDLSRDGSKLVYRGPPSEASLPQLWLRQWDDIEATPVRGTTAALEPAFSPDGDAVAFRQEGEVHAIPLTAGPKTTFGPGRFPRWLDDGHIYVTGDSGVVRYPENGGTGVQVTRIREGEAGHIVVAVSPDGRRALLWVGITGGPTEIHRIDLESGDQERLVTGEGPTVLPTGHLVYQMGGSLFAAPFDVDEMAMTGEPVPVADNVRAFRASEDGKLFYSTGSSGNAQEELVWVRRGGAATPVEPGWAFDSGADNDGWSLSPDGRRIALRELTESGLDIWVKEVDGGPRSRLTFAEEEDRKPVWGPDGETVTFLSSRGENLDVLSRRADGTGGVQLVYDFERPIAEAFWAPDGTLVFRSSGVAGQVGGRDIQMIRPGEEEEPTPLLTAAYDEISPALSPDGRWLAYTSNETGQHEVFVRPFPDVESGRWQVSTDGGLSPKWSRDGSEIFYVSGARHMMAASVRTEPSFSVAARLELFSLAGSFIQSDISVPYDVGEGERQFLMGRAYAGRSEGAAPPPRVMLVTNWLDELRARVPTR
jgi:serine/threonine-protein kinase